MKWIIAACGVVVFALIWILIFKLALKNPNNGNEFSRDEKWGRW
jgi:hypothetical protein